MCGIATFLSNEAWASPADLSAFRDLAGRLDAATAAENWAPVAAALDRLADLFLPLNGFALHAEIAQHPAAHALLTAIGGSLALLRRRAEAEIAAKGRSDLVEQIKERLSDYLWQVENEVLANVARIGRLLPAGETGRPARFLAWSVETVLQSLDKLEVRGRDSAGIGIVLDLDGDQSVEAGLSAALKAELHRRLELDETSAQQMLIGRHAGGWALRTTYKVANLVGRLGDNGAALRAAIAGDSLLWAIAPRLRAINIVSHTRWASNGIINVPNCHPVDGRTSKNGVPGDNADARAATFVLNGDVDNYATLVATSVQSRGLTINPAVSTDTKILPVVFALDTGLDDPLDTRFLGVMRRCHGSLAIVLQHLGHPRRQMAGQKGSGQALYIGQLPEGFISASEVYGIAALCRAYWPMNAGGELGVAVELDGRGELTLTGHALAGGAAWLPPTEKIQIFARDIFRGDFPTYIEKEVSEAPSSVKKTLAGKYLTEDGKFRFLVQGFGNGDLLLRRLTTRDQPAVRRIIVVGQGTAAVAGMGIAHLIRRAVAPAGITVEAGKASELFGFMADGRFDDAMVVAVSQSGTTTDTNRIVDLAKSRGAWIHAIVNRRNSALVQKAHSFLYTSDGRDVEMSVASTKAYYSQVTAGKLLGLLLASQLGTLTEHQILDDIHALEALPSRIQAVLDRRGEVGAIAAQYAPYARNWALVGNGANRIAAEEIRIKLSELCYKAIPCDVTEDKKHIDLSTEPMTLVIANDLPEMVVSDTVKEVSIFKAHNGRPLVLCAEGENRFDAVAEAVFALPVVGGGLDFVVATVAGHLFGIAAAQAIDRSCVPFREVRAVLSRGADDFVKADLAAALDRALASVETGITDSALAARLVVALARYHAWLDQQPDAIPAAEARLDQLQLALNAVIDDLTRPIDTIRHQAKTVTVGISRPQQEVSPLILDALSTLAIPESRIAERDREMLEMLSPLVTAVRGAVVYDVTALHDDPVHPAWELQAVQAMGESRLDHSRYVTRRLAEGTKRKALRTGSAITATGHGGGERLAVVPLAAPSGNAVSALLLLHLEVTPKASLQQKVAVLKALSHKYDELTEHLAEHHPHIAMDALLADADPGTLIFASIHDIVAGLTP